MSYEEIIRLTLIENTEFKIIVCFQYDRMTEVTLTE